MFIKNSAKSPLEKEHSRTILVDNFSRTICHSQKLWKLFLTVSYEYLFYLPVDIQPTK